MINKEELIKDLTKVLKKHSNTKGFIIGLIDDEMNVSVHTRNLYQWERSYILMTAHKIALDNMALTEENLEVGE